MSNKYNVGDILEFKTGLKYEIVKIENEDDDLVDILYLGLILNAPGYTNNMGSDYISLFDSYITENLKKS